MIFSHGLYALSCQCRILASEVISSLRSQLRRVLASLTWAKNSERGVAASQLINDYEK